MSCSFPTPLAPSRLQHRFNLVLLGLLLWLLGPQRSARAEDSLLYKFQTWQEDDGRVRVDSHYAQAETTLSTETRLKIMGVIDTISGATPSGQPITDGSDQVPLSELTDRREAWHIEAAQPWRQYTLSASYSDSRESDYISQGWSTNLLTDFNEKNTTLMLGYARANDEITASFLPERYTKTADDFIIGLTQLLDPATVLTCNLTYGESSGYLNDPYKIIGQTQEILAGISLDLTFPENRPTTRRKWIGYVGLNRSFENVNGALEASYRYFNDDWGIDSHTLELSWFQRFGERFILQPSVRFYQQSAADFYFVDLNDTGIDPGLDPSFAAPYFSADHRLSDMRTWMLGVKAVWEVTPWCTVDVAVQRYLMEGRDGITPASAYSDANVFTVGIKLWR